MRRGAANGVAGVAAEADQAEAGGDGGRGSAAGSGGDAIERVGIAGVAGEDRVDGFVGAEGPLGHIGLGEHDGAGILDALHLEGVLIGEVAGESERAVGGLQAVGFEVVLDDHRARSAAGR